MPVLKKIILYKGKEYAVDEITASLISAKLINSFDRNNFDHDVSLQGTQSSVLENKTLGNREYVSLTFKQGKEEITKKIWSANLLYIIHQWEERLQVLIPLSEFPELIASDYSHQ